jgi:hypothetical protein
MAAIKIRSNISLMFKEDALIKFVIFMGGNVKVDVKS